VRVSPGEGLVLCDCRTAAGEPIELDPRHVLRSSQAAQAAETRLSFALDLPARPEEDRAGAPAGRRRSSAPSWAASAEAGSVCSRCSRSAGELVRLTFAADAALTAADAAVIAQSA